LGDRRRTPGLPLFAALKSAFLLLASALVLTLPSDLAGQTIRGKILDEITGEPISNADVELLAGSKGDEVVGRTLTDAAGVFLLDAGAQGRFRLSAERIGYQKVIAPPVDIIAGDTLAVELRMAVDAIPLAPLTVVSDRPPLLLRIRLEEGGYAERRDLYGGEGLGMGHFLLESDWEHRSPHLIADIVREVPGVRIVGASIRMRAITSFDPGGCVPSFYLDGNLVRLRGESIEDLISPFSITAVEVYPGMSRPPQFMDMLEHPCGAIVLWTM
jgi:hypothetical protein